MVIRGTWPVSGSRYQLPNSSMGKGGLSQKEPGAGGRSAPQAFTLAASFSMPAPGEGGGGGVNTGEPGRGEGGRSAPRRRTGGGEVAEEELL